QGKRHFGEPADRADVARHGPALCRDRNDGIAARLRSRGGGRDSGGALRSGGTGAGNRCRLRRPEEEVPSASSRWIEAKEGVLELNEPPGGGAGKAFQERAATRRRKWRRLREADDCRFVGISANET